MEYWTDYPLAEFGDHPGRPAPKREAIPVAYDGDKYVVCHVHGLRVEFKAGYLYAGKLGKPAKRDFLNSLPRQEPQP